jgi:hypothetical protein
MKPIELVAQIRQDNPSVLAGMSDATAVVFVRAVYEQIGKTLAAAQPGVLRMIGLGQFVVRDVEREVDGQKISRRQIVVVRPGEKGKKGAAEAGDA